MTKNKQTWLYLKNNAQCCQITLSRDGLALEFIYEPVANFYTILAFF